MISNNHHFKIIEASFPRIGKQIALFFGQPDFVNLLKELTVNTRSTPRVGFPADVLFALHELEAEHDSAFPHLRRDSQQHWH